MSAETLITAALIVGIPLYLISQAIESLAAAVRERDDDESKRGGGQ